MMALVLGASGSGKSLYAEGLASRFAAGSRELYYIATMIPHGDDGALRVAKHRKQRETKGFVTVERPFFVSGLEFKKDAVVLLEDVSNLLANAMFADGDGDKKNRTFEDDVFADIKNLREKCRAVVVVTIDALDVKPEYDGETVNYINALNKLNEKLVDFADIVVTMRGGEAVFLKGEAYVRD
jgi:adenosylcobinamide kinase/adenosylcobinamide-phosphate guanylyltransferase